MNQDKLEIQNKIMEIMRELFQLPNSTFSDASAKKPLTGEPFSLNANAMVYLFFEIEKQMQVRFTQSEVIEYRFSTVEQIVSTVYKKVSAVTNGCAS